MRSSSPGCTFVDAEVVQLESGKKHHAMGTKLRSSGLRGNSWRPEEGYRDNSIFRPGNRPRLHRESGKPSIHILRLGSGRKSAPLRRLTLGTRRIHGVLGVRRSQLLRIEIAR